MDGLNPFFTLAIGLLLRLGLPLALTAAVITLLRHLDRRWQKEALTAPVVAVECKPCWEVKGCPESLREECLAAATQPRIPCWQFFRSQTGLLREECLGCSVFRQGPAPVTI